MSDSESANPSGRISGTESSPILPKISEKDDDFAVSSDSDAWSLGSDQTDRSERSSSFGSSPLRSPSSESYTSDTSRRDSASSMCEPVVLFPMSSDSYFSHNRARLAASRTGTPDSEVRRRQRTARHHRRSSSESISHRHHSRSRSRAAEDSEVSPAAQIYKNLLILEETLRQQSSEQSRLRTKYTMFVVSMLIVLVIASYSLVVSERQVVANYWRLLCEVVCSIDILTLVLYYLSGEYTRTIARPRRFLTYANKGVRRFNIRLVKVHVKSVDRFVDMIKACIYYPTIGLKWQCRKILQVAPSLGFVEKLNNWLVEFEVKLQTSSSRNGVEGVKLVLNPRVFSTGTREQWELYRNEFWNKETIRRRQVLQRKQQ